jgi:hypothetical protein
MKKIFGNRLLYIVALVISVAAIIVRFLWLDADPPLCYSGMGQSILTDPYQFVHHARSKILMGDWDIFDYSRWMIFKTSLASVLGYTFFLIGGVSRVMANLSGVILNLSGMLFFLGGLRRYIGNAFVIAAILLLANMTLMAYGRFPYLENGMIFLCGLLFFLFVKYYPAGWVLILTGALTALCALSGKMYGIMMIAPVVVVILLDNPRASFRRFMVVLVSLILFLVLFAFIFYGGHIKIIYNYLSEQTVGMYGLPKPLFSPGQFFKHLMTFGGQSRLFYYSPFFLFMIVISVLFMILSPSKWGDIKNNRALLFSIGWLLFGYLLLMTFNYRPLRYQLFLTLPAAGIVASVFNLAENDLKAIKLDLWRISLTFLLAWYICTQAGILLSLYMNGRFPGSNVVWQSLLAAVVLSAIILVVRMRVTGFFRFLPHSIILLLVLSVGYQSILIYKWFSRKSYTLLEANYDLAGIVDPEAVITGPYAPALTIDNKLRSFIYMFGLSRKELRLFDGFPITHLAVDEGNWEKALEDYPVLEGSSSLTRYSIRDVEVVIFRVPDSLLESHRRSYNLTDYEKAMVFSGSPETIDSTLYYITKFLNVNPQSKSGLRQLAEYYFKKSMPEKGFRIFDKLISLYPDDFSIYFDRALWHYHLYLLTSDDSMMSESDFYFKKAVSLNPYISPNIANAKMHADTLLPQ